MTQWLRAEAKGRPIGVDRDTEYGVLRGYIVAEEGPFKTGRGEFNKKSLKQIVKLANGSPKGLKSRMGHPNESDDGVGKFLGRVRSAWYEEFPGGADMTMQLGRVRGDLYFSKSSHDVPGKGDLAKYFMDRAEEDADSFSSSLVLDIDQEYRLEKDGRPMRDKDGNELPPLWMPKKLYASDIVDEGDAVSGGLLSTELSMLTQDILVKGCELLDRQFSGKDREFVRKHLEAFVGRYLSHRFDVPMLEYGLPEDQWLSPEAMCAAACRTCEAACKEADRAQTPGSLFECANQCDKCAAACEECELPECRECETACRRCAFECRLGPSDKCKAACQECAAACKKCAKACDKEATTQGVEDDESEGQKIGDMGDMTAATNVAIGDKLRLMEMEANAQAASI